MSHGEETFFVSFIVILHIVCVAHLITIVLWLLQKVNAG